MKEKKELSSRITTEDQLAAEKETVTTGEKDSCLHNKEELVKSAADDRLDIDEKDAHFGLPENEDPPTSLMEATRAVNVIDNWHFGGKTGHGDQSHFGGESEKSGTDAVTQPRPALQTVRDEAETNRTGSPDFNNVWEEMADEPEEKGISTIGETNSVSADIQDKTDAPVFDLPGISDAPSEFTDDAAAPDEPVQSDGSVAADEEDTVLLDSGDVDAALAEVMDAEETDGDEQNDDALFDIIDDFEENELTESTIVNLWELAGETATDQPFNDKAPADTVPLGGLTDLEDIAEEPLDVFSESAEEEDDSQFLLDEDDLELNILDDSDDLDTELFGNDDLFDPIDLEDDQQDVVELTGDESVISVDEDSIFDLSALAGETDDRPLIEADDNPASSDIDNDGLFEITDLAGESATEKQDPADLMDDLDALLNPEGSDKTDPALTGDDDLFEFDNLDDSEIQDPDDPYEPVVDLTDEEAAMIDDDDESLFEEDEPVIDLTDDLLDDEDAPIDLIVETLVDDDSDILQRTDSTDEQDGIIDLLDEDVDLDDALAVDEGIEEEFKAAGEVKADGLAEHLGIDTATAAESIPDHALTSAISRQQLDQALERVVQKMLADKIDPILTEVIERAVTREINRIKTILLDNSSEAE